MRNIISFLFVLLSVNCYSQGTISGKIFLPSGTTLTRLPKVAVYNGSTSNYVSTLTVAANGTFSYSYPTNNTTYYFEPYFDAFDTTQVTTSFTSTVANEANYLSSPDNVQNLYLDKGYKWWASDVKDNRTLDLGQGYLVATKKYFGTFSRSYNVTTTTTNTNTSVKIFKTHNGNGSTSQYAQYPSTRVEMDKLFNTSYSNTTLFWSGTIGASSSLNFNQYTTLTSAGASVPTNGEYYSTEVTFTFTPKETGTYTFGLTSDDGGDLYLMGFGNVIEWYGGKGTGTYYYGSVSLTKGNSYTFIARMQEYGGGDGLLVNWKRPSQSTYSLQTDEVGGTTTTTTTYTTSYRGPKVYWFTQTVFDNMTTSNWSSQTPLRYFPVTITTGNASLNIKYIVVGNLTLSSQ
jgi:hypothetical protein